MSADPASQLLRGLLGRGQPQSAPAKPADSPPEDPRTPSDRLRYYRENPDAVRQKLSLPPNYDPIVLGLQWEYPKPDAADQGPPDYSAGAPGEPIAISRDLLKNGHMHVRGRTRSGKSSLAITPLLAQLARPYAAYAPDGRLITTDFKDAIFVFDLGGDLALFNFAKQLAGDDRTFRFLSLEPDDEWHFFDPLQAATGGPTDRLIRIAILLQQAFSLDHGLVYGGSYYSQRNLSALLNVAHTVTQKKRGTAAQTTIDDIAFHLQHQNVKDADEIRMIFQFLLEYEQLKPTDPLAENVINMQRALDRAEVIYFFCPTIGEAMTARQIAGLGLYTLINAAMQRVQALKPEQRGMPLPHAWVFVDEFQELAGRSYASLLAQASKFGLSLIMANQTTAQLSTRDMSLADIVRDNTFAKMYFTVTGVEDIKGIQAFSKESSRMLTGTSEDDRPFDPSTRRTLSEVIVPSLKADEILHTSSTDKHCFLILDDGTRHREPIRLWTDYVLDANTFHTFKHTPPPKITEPRRTPLEPADPQEPLWKIARRRQGPSDWHQPLAGLLARKRAEEALH